MHIGYQLSNILESVASNNQDNIDALYLCHNSIFDLFLPLCNIELNNYDSNNTKFLENNKLISTWPTNELIKPYSIHIVNSPLGYLKNNNSLHFHLNTVVFAHDIGLLSIKKEDAFLLCGSAFRPGDTMVYFNSIMSNYNCPKITTTKLDYAIPDSIQNTNHNKNGIAIFAYNKTLGSDLINSIDPSATQLNALPGSIETLNNDFNQYELFIELDPASIINALVAIACGGVAVVLDPNNILLDYKDIPNLFIANSLSELKQILLQKPKFSTETTEFDYRFRNFNNFSNTITTTIKATQRKAFIL